MDSGKQVAFLMLVAIGLAIGAVFTGLHTERFVSSAATVMGTVEQVDSVSEGEEGYGVRIAYTDVQGRRRKLRTGTRLPPSAHWLHPFQVGNRVPVLYQPGRPATARVGSFLQLWQWSVIFGAGCAIALLGAGVVWKSSGPGFA